MIAIPNMKKPKGCLECWSGLSIAINCEAGKGFWNPNGDRIPPDCPLIEIDDEIWEALKPKVETMSLAERGWITDDSNT